MRFEPDSGAYTGLTFTFDPRLERRALEWLHVEHWQSIMQTSSAMLYESLGGRAHLAEVRVLIPYKWRALDWPLMQKPGSPVMTNRRVRYADSDVVVGFDGKYSNNNDDTSFEHKPKCRRAARRICAAVFD